MLSVHGHSSIFPLFCTWRVVHFIVVCGHSGPEELLVKFILKYSKLMTHNSCTFQLQLFQISHICMYVYALLSQFLTQWLFHFVSKVHYLNLCSIYCCQDILVINGQCCVCFYIGIIMLYSFHYAFSIECDGVAIDYWALSFHPNPLLMIV